MSYSHFKDFLKSSGSPGIYTTRPESSSFDAIEVQNEKLKVFPGATPFFCPQAKLRVFFLYAHIFDHTELIMLHLSPLKAYTSEL